MGAKTRTSRMSKGIHSTIDKRLKLDIKRSKKNTFLVADGLMKFFSFKEKFKADDKLSVKWNIEEHLSSLAYKIMTSSGFSIPWSKAVHAVKSEKDIFIPKVIESDTSYMKYLCDVRQVKIKLTEVEKYKNILKI